MKKLIESIAQGVVDGFDAMDAYRGKYTFEDIYNFLAECISRIFMGLIFTVILIVVWFKFKIGVSLGGILITVWAFVFYGIVESQDYKNIKKK